MPQSLPLPSLPERVSQLSERRQEIIRQVVESPKDYVLLSVRAMAQKLQTDPATIIRIVNGMGFESFKDFQKYLHGLSLARATSFNSTLTDLQADSTMPAHIRASLDEDFKNLTSMRQSVDFERMAALAHRICSARKVVLLGADLAASLVDYLEYKLTVLALPVFAAKEPGRTIHIINGLTSEDVVIAMSFHRGLRLVVEAVQRAQANGAYCVGITDSQVSPIARFADEFFLAPVTGHAMGDSYVAPLALLNVILVSCANLRREKTIEILKQAEEEQRTGSRWYEDKLNRIK